MSGCRVRRRTSLLFDDDHDTKWRRALGILKIDPLLLSGAAGHA